MKSFWIILFLIAVLFAPLGHDLARYSFPSSLVWNDSSWVVGIFLIFWVGNFLVQKKREKFSFGEAFIFLFIYFLIFSLELFILPHPRNFVSIFPYVLCGTLLWFFSFIRNRRISLVLSFGLIGVLSLHAQWAILDFVLQHDLGFTLLGEPRLSPLIPGVAKFSFADTKLIRGYGPYLHSNALSSAMLSGCILLSYIWMRFGLFKIRRADIQVPFFVIFATLFFALLITFSRAAYLGFFLYSAFLFVLYRKYVRDLLYVLKPYLVLGFILLLLFSPFLHSRVGDPDGRAVVERLQGYFWYEQLLYPSLIFYGAGFGNYIYALSDYLVSQHIPFESWQLAPIHNSVLLSVFEFGLVPFVSLVLVFILFIQKLYRPSLTLFILLLLPTLPLLLLDHYLLSLPSTLVVLESSLLLVLILGSPTTKTDE